MNSHQVTTDDSPFVSEAGARLLVAANAQEAADPRFAFSPNDLGNLLGVGPTRVAQLIAEGEVDSWVEGTRRKIAKPSAYALVRKRIIDSNPPEGAVKVRQPSTMFRKKQRPRTEAELRGLAAGNAKRHAEALARREAARAGAESAPADT
jgi:hypothetical protein